MAALAFPPPCETVTVTAFLLPPALDPTPIFEAFRGNYATELLTAAVAHFRVFERLARGPRSTDELRRELGLQERPAVVLFTALRALKLVIADEAGRLDLSEQARQNLVPGSPFDVS